MSFWTKTSCNRLRDSENAKIQIFPVQLTSPLNYIFKLKSKNTCNVTPLSSSTKQMNAHRHKSTKTKFRQIESHTCSAHKRSAFCGSPSGNLLELAVADKASESCSIAKLPLLTRTSFLLSHASFTFLKNIKMLRSFGGETRFKRFLNMKIDASD